MERFSHGGDIYLDAKKYIDFSANINPLNLPEAARNAILENIDNIVNYPDPRSFELVDAISKFYGIGKENIILGNGASELIYLIFLKLRFKKTLIIAPSFSDYERAALTSGSAVEFFFLEPDNNFRFHWEKIIEKAKNFDAVIFGSPNNPTGTLASLKDVERFVEQTPEKVFVIIDESFLDFRRDRKLYETFNIAASEKNVFTIRSLTKFYALPGLRLGFGVSNKSLTQKLNLSKDVWNVNLLAQAAGVAAVKDLEYRKKSLDFIEAEQKFMTEALNKLNIKFYPPTVNFILLEFEAKTAAKIRKALKEKGVLVRNCENFVGLGENFIRVAIRNREENECLIKYLKALLPRE